MKTIPTYQHSWLELRAQTKTTAGKEASPQAMGLPELMRSRRVASVQINDDSH